MELLFTSPSDKARALARRTAPSGAATIEADGKDRQHPYDFVRNSRSKFRGVDYVLATTPSNGHNRTIEPPDRTELPARAPQPMIGQPFT